MTEDATRLRRWTTLAASLAVGALGGFLASAAGGPMPWMMGAVAANAVWTVGFPGRLNPVWFPEALRNGFVVVIGVMIGGLFTAELLARLPGWWPGVLGVIAYALAAQVAAYALLRRLGRFDRVTAWFAASPGGLIENIVMGEALGGDRRAIAALQFLRIVIVIFALPFGFSLWVGHAVGSAGGAALDGGKGATELLDLALLAATGIGGFLAGRALRVPAGHMIGPILASAALHLSGAVTTQPPALAIVVAQVVIGSSLGARFAGLAPATLRRLVGLALAMGALMLALALAFSAALAPLTDESAALYLMAFAPGGVIEMGLIALTLGANPVFVTTHHIIRIFATVFLTPWLFRRFFARPDG